MSDDEMHSDEGEEEIVERRTTTTTVVKQEMPVETGPTEAEMALQRRKQQIQSTDALDEFAAEILEQSRQRREALEEEIEELRQRNERRKQERAEEEKLLMARRQEEEARLKAEAEERKAKKQEEAAKKKAALAEKMAEFEKWKQPQEEPKEEKKSKEQLEAEKRAILGQRIHPLEISGFDTKKLTDKANELHAYIYRLESEKYDLEKRFKEQQVDMLELAERARSMNKVGKGGFKRVQLTEDERDVIQEKYAGTSAKIEMYSKYERQKDKRSYGERRTIFTGPQYGFPAERLQPRRILGWDEDGIPIYTGGSAPAPPPPEPEPQEEVAAEEE